MKRLFILAAAASMALTPLAASAQQYRYHDGRGWEREYHRDRDRDGRPDYRDRYDNRRDYYGHRRWERGQRYDRYRDRSYIVHDYHRYGWRAPPRGYAYYRTDTGDVVIAAIATGIITSIIAGALNDHPHQRYDYYGRPVY